MLGKLLRSCRLQAAGLSLLVVGLGCSAANHSHPLNLDGITPPTTPQRPDFVQFVDGDFLPCSFEARARLLKRHAQIRWYLNELEATNRAWEQFWNHSKVSEP